MAFEHEKAQARRMLEGIENGSMSAAQSRDLLEAADPTLVYFIFTWLRTRYANHPAAEGVIGRVVAICEAYPAVARQAKEGQRDALVGWFEDEYSYRDLDGSEFISLVVEKLEG